MARLKTLSWLLVGCLFTNAHGMFTSNSSLLSANEESSQQSHGQGQRLLREIFSIQPAFAPADSKSDLCRVQSKIFLRALQRLEVWALKMHDSTGKIAAGLLNGNVNQLGDFQQCLSIEHHLPDHSGNSHAADDETNVIYGKYCLARAYLEPTMTTRSKVKDDAGEDVLDLMHSHKLVQSTAYDGVRFFPSFSAISWAFCLPASCSPLDLERSLRRLARKYNTTAEGLRVHVRVDQDACVMRSKTSTPVRKTTIFTGLLVLTVVGLAVLGTIYDLRIQREAEAEELTRKKKKQTETPLPGLCTRLALAFSLKRNVGDLLKSDTPFDDIHCLHGIRAMFSLIIYLIHRGVFGLFVPFTNRTELAEDFEGGWTMIFRAFLNNVDTFVVLSGLLTAYYSVKKLESGKRLNIPMMYLQRYVKFTPIFLVTVLIVKDMDYFVQSPQAIRVAQHFVNGCKNGFWKSLFYINNFDGMDHMCYPPSHQLVTDMQMYLLAPFIVLLMYKSPRVMAALLTMALGALAVLRYFVIHRWHLSTFIYHGITLSQMLDGADRMYLNPIHRLTPYLSGLMLGYYLRVSGRKSAFSAEQMYAGWSIAAVSGYYSFFGPSEVAQRGYVYDPDQSAMFGVLQPCLWSLALCWTIYACFTGYGGLLNKMLSWHGFVVFSKLSYAFYMVQIVLIFGGIATIRTPQYYRMTSVLDLNELFLLVASSVTLTLLFLLPLTHLWQIFTGADVAASKLQTPPSKGRNSVPTRSLSMIDARRLGTLWIPEKKEHRDGKAERTLRFRDGYLGFLNDNDARQLD